MAITASDTDYNTSLMTPQPPPGSPLDLDELSLWGPDGQPHPDDIQQDSFNTCPVLGTAAGVAGQQPQALEKLVQRNGDGSLTVSFWEHSQAGNKNSPLVLKPYHVTKAQVELVIGLGGSSRHDNDANANNGYWPAALEAGWIVKHTPPGGTFAAGIKVVQRGANEQDAFEALVGDAGVPTRLKPEPGETLSNRVERDFTRLSAAHADGKIMMVAARKESPLVDKNGVVMEVKDGLVNGHGYTITGFSRGKDGTPMVTLRTPWNTNRPAAGIDMEGAESDSAYETKPLSQLYIGGNNQLLTGRVRSGAGPAEPPKAALASTFPAIHFDHVIAAVGNVFSSPNTSPSTPSTPMNHVKVEDSRGTYAMGISVKSVEPVPDTALGRFAQGANHLIDGLFGIGR